MIKKRAAIKEFVKQMAENEEFFQRFEKLSQEEETEVEDLVYAEFELLEKRFNKKSEKYEK